MSELKSMAEGLLADAQTPGYTNGYRIDLCKRLVKAVEQREAENERLRTALEFYADTERPKNDTCLWCDHGKKAREALNNEAVASGSGAMEESQ